MSNKNTNIGVQLMPLVLIVAAIGFYILLNWFLSVCCFVMALMMWFVLYGESTKR